jgi:hypothetical protein
MIFPEYWQSTKCNRATLNTPSHRSRRPAAVFAQSSIAWAIDSIANPHLNDDPGAIIAFPDETFGLSRAAIFTPGISRFKSIIKSYYMAKNIELIVIRFKLTRLFATVGLTPLRR